MDCKWEDRSHQLSASNCSKITVTFHFDGDKCGHDADLLLN